MRNEYLENRHQAQVNKARGQGYAGVRLFLFLFLFLKVIYFRELLPLLLIQMLVLLVVSRLK